MKLLKYLWNDFKKEGWQWFTLGIVIGLFIKYLQWLYSLFPLMAESIAQDSYKERTICTDWNVYKGNKNHGQKYCVAWAIVREHKNGKTDTVSWYGGLIVYADGEYEQYQKLSERGKYIVDSLKEDGMPRLNQSYLSYEPMYMKPGNKVETFWHTNGKDVFIYKYQIWKNVKSSGCRLLKSYQIK